MSPPGSPKVRPDPLFRIHAQKLTDELHCEHLGIG